MTTPTPTASVKIVTTQYYPNTGTIESTTTESVGLLSGKKAEDLTAAIQCHKNVSKALCCVIIPTAVIGIALLIATIVVGALGGSMSNTRMAVLAPMTAVCLGIAFSLTMIYCLRKAEPITLAREAITV